jgi:hypothetical protein
LNAAENCDAAARCWIDAEQRIARVVPEVDREIDLALRRVPLGGGEAEVARLL